MFAAQFHAILLITLLPGVLNEDYCIFNCREFVSASAGIIQCQELSKFADSGGLLIKLTYQYDQSTRRMRDY